MRLVVFFIFLTMSAFVLGLPAQAQVLGFGQVTGSSCVGGDNGDLGRGLLGNSCVALGSISGGKVLWEEGQKWVSGASGQLYDWPTLYVPTSGYYQAAISFCYATVLTSCTTQNGSHVIKSVSQVYLDANESISDQNPNFGNFSYTLTQSAGYCLWIQDTSTLQGYQAGSVTNNLACSNLPAFSTTSPVGSCTLNGGNPLDINMGTIDLSDISQCSSLSCATVKKTIDISCTGSTDLTYTISFNGFEHMGDTGIQTSNPGLNVRMFYSTDTFARTIVGGSAFTDTFEPGANSRSFAFAVEPDDDGEEITTGGFTASSVMEIEIQ